MQWRLKAEHISFANIPLNDCSLPVLAYTGAAAAYEGFCYKPDSFNCAGETILFKTRVTPHRVNAVSYTHLTLPTKRIV